MKPNCIKNIITLYVEICISIGIDLFLKLCIMHVADKENIRLILLKEDRKFVKTSKLIP